MTDHLPDFPHDELPEDEISKKNAPARTPRKPRGKSFLGKLLFLLLIAAIILGGILYVQQSLLDLEAEAQVYALQTASASSKSNPAEVTSMPLCSSHRRFHPDYRSNGNTPSHVQATITTHPIDAYQTF